MHVLTRFLTLADDRERHNRSFSFHSVVFSFCIFHKIVKASNARLRFVIFVNFCRYFVFITGRLFPFGRTITSGFFRLQPAEIAFSRLYGRWPAFSETTGYSPFLSITKRKATLKINSPVQFFCIFFGSCISFYFVYY